MREMNTLVLGKECSGVAEKWDFLVFLRVGLTIPHKEMRVCVLCVCNNFLKNI